MAKKKRSRSKQSVSSAKPRNYSAMYKGDNTVPQVKSEASESTPGAATEKTDSDQVDWKGEYAYVSRDLRMLTIVSVVLFAVIIGIGFIL